ncbi:EpsG family protein [Eudoraea chungangensis]|uniref:EpsG family protein n=1 Tax=Eudoraea chungangensis TaxID=1481905 RepID=UPI0023EDFB2C|nr:EpsG family protein [Eudoraea chungangensis]
MTEFFTFFVYLATLFSSVLLARNGFHLNKLKYDRGNYFIVGCSLLVLVLVSGLRYDTGKDYQNYSYLYEEVQFMDNTAELDMEIGYTVLVEFLNNLNLEVWSFFMISAFLTYILFFYSFNKYKPILYLGIFFYITYGFYFYSFNGVRQAIAMSALSVAVMFAQERKIVLYLVVILLGGLMHKSLFLFIPLYFVINQIRFSSLFWYLAFGISLLLHFVPFDNLVDLYLLSEILSGTQVDYGNFAMGLTENANEAGSLTLGYLIRVGIGFFILSFYSKLIKVEPSSLPYFTLALIGIILYNSFSHILFMTRINYYFLLFSTFALAFIIRYLFVSNQLLLANSVLVFFIMLYCYGIYVGENGCSPYTFITF